MTTAVLQLRFLNKAMEHFPAAVVVPTYYLTFTLSSIAGGVWVFSEAWRPYSWLTPVPKQEYLFFAGCLVAFLGVYFIAVKPKEKPAAALLSANVSEDGQQPSISRVNTWRESTSELLSNVISALSPAEERSPSPLPGVAGRSPWQEPIGPEPLATADLRGSVNVVTGVGTLQHLYCAFGTRRSAPFVGTDPLGGLPVEPLPASDACRAESGENLSASLMSNDHGG